MFKLVRAQITQYGMTATTMGKALDVKKYIRFSFDPGLIPAMMGEFRFKGTKETFHHRIFQTISDAAHPSADISLMI